MFVRICIIAAVLLAAVTMALAQAENADTTPLAMEGRMAYDKVIPVLLNAGAGDQQDIARLQWIVFHKQDRQVSADLRMVLVSWPKGKWHISVDLLGKEDKLLQSAQSVFENGGFIISTPAYSEEDIHFDLGPSKDVDGARRFRVTIGPAAEDAKVDAQIVGPPSPHGYSKEGNRTINVSVPGGGFKPPSVDTTLWRRVGPDYVEQPLSAFHDTPVTWQFGGMTWVPIHHYAGYTKIEDLGEDLYMITALTNAGNQSSDPTPAGFSGIIDLTGPNTEQNAVIPLRGISSLTVRIVDSARKPLKGEQILLRAPNGMPIADGSHGFHMAVNDEGTMRFGALDPGIYRLEIGPRNWWSALHPESIRVVSVPVRLGVENEVTVLYTHPEPKRG